MALLDTLRTHVKGVLTRNPGWESALAGFSVESAWMVGAWDDVENLVEETKAQSPSVAMARVLLAIRSGQKSAIADSLSVARSILGPPIMAAGAKGYRRSYDAVLDLHLTHELQIIHDAMQQFPTNSQGDGQKMRREILNELSKSLASRLESSLPTLRTREPLLSMRRTAFALRSGHRQSSLRTSLTFTLVLGTRSPPRLAERGSPVLRLLVKLDSGRPRTALFYKLSRPTRGSLSWKVRSSSKQLGNPCGHSRSWRIPCDYLGSLRVM